MTILRTTPDTGVIVEHKATKETSLVVADDHGVLRDPTGAAYRSTAYEIVDTGGCD